MNLSPHFSLEELIRSDTAVRKGIDNKPDADVLSNLYVLANGLERVRDVLGSPVRITSGYRCPKLNSAIGSKPSSQHIQGLAADFRSDYGSLEEIVLAIVEQKDFIDYDQLILEFPNRNGWVHISFSDTPRKQSLVYDGDSYRPLAIG